jgi:hypothetical protein
MEAISNTMDMTRGLLEAKTEGTAAHSAAKASSAKAPVGDVIIKARTMSMPDVQPRALADSGFMRSPPIPVGLRPLDPWLKSETNVRCSPHSVRARAGQWRRTVGVR